ncbi:hypothetical protein [Natronorarus salvus]
MSRTIHDDAVADEQPELELYLPGTPSLEMLERLEGFLVRLTN